MEEGVEEWYLSCPFLGQQVHLSETQLKHIQSRHPELPLGTSHLADCLLEPDMVVRTIRYQQSGESFGFCRWVTTDRKRKFLLVVVADLHEDPPRPFVLTAYFRSRPIRGEVLWKRPEA